ncbi:MAG: AAA family ATPase [Lachnospiraceae bacterium]|nr:AAA family ATPase [Lachnospiraceae bacterium]
MLKRKILKELDAWNSKRDRKCLVVQGARQVGKTFAIREYAKNTYKKTIEINFKEIPDAAEIFAGNLNVENMLRALRFRYPGVELSEGQTLLFLDEIQECPEAITSLKFWTQYGKLDVIASGSMLGIDYKRSSSYPVGYVEFLKMYGLDFEEFLWAVGVSESDISELREMFENRKVVQPAVHTVMMNHFRTYMALGGMPEVVNTYVTGKDFSPVDRVQKELLQGYLYDIAHYATAEEKIKAEKCFISLSKQLLNKENRKFQYKEIETGARAQKYYSSIDWLMRADIVRLSNYVNKLEYDLEDYSDSSNFKVYTSDLSLLIAMRDFAFKQHVIENSLVGTTKGGIYECAIADCLIKKGYRLFYYKNETTKRELDFVIQKGGKVVPIEVKAGNNRADSLNKYMEKSKIDMAYKFIDGNVGSTEERIVTMPHYMVMFV